MANLNVDPTTQNASLAKGLQLLEAFDRGRSTSLTLTQLIELTGLEKSAVQRFTATLVRLGYLRKDLVRRHYTLAPRLLHLGTSYLRTNALVERAMPYLLEWSKEQDETVNLGELDQQDIIITYRFRTRRVVSSDISIGSSFRWHAASMGQAIAAFLPEHQQAALCESATFPSYTAQTLKTKEAVLARLNQVRSDGYAFCVGETYDEDISIAAPIFGSDGHVVAAVATAVLLTQWTPAEAKEKLVPSVQTLARAITGVRRATGI